MAAGAALLLLWPLSGCGTDHREEKERTYVGSRVCLKCHPDQHAAMHESGHPFALNPVIDGNPPSYPFSQVPDSPPRWVWAQMRYVVGGYRWKANFLGPDGYLITGDEAQYTLADRSFSAYHPEDAPGNRPFDCGGCHATGWVATGPDGPFQDGLAGIHGTFVEAGVTCEACHGPASVHIETLSAFDITVDRSKELCGSCHHRDDQHRIAAADGFIQHNAQYDELVSAGHAVHQCVTCHTPHRGVVYPLSAGLTASCEDCHASQAENLNHNAAPTCVQCHMPRATLSALAVNEHIGDVRTHIFAIDTSDATKGSMWYEEDGQTFATGRVTLDFVCYQCHKDENGEGGYGSYKSMQDLSAAAQSMHQP